MSRLAPALFDLATEHDGVFTAGEAAEAGISHAALAMAARRGTIRRLSRGIYRLAAYPADEERVQLWQAVLWPTTQRGSVAPWGVVSHLSALRAHYALLEYAPPKVSIIIPRATRLRREPPTWLEIHPADLPNEDVTSLQGLPTTSLERTLHDCIDAGVDRRLILRTLDGMNDRTLPPVLRDSEIAALRARLG